MGWVTSELPGGDHHVVKVELKGPENTLRVRQVKLMGWKDGESIKIAGQISASVAQQKNCEAETLRVFRLITSQVSPLHVDRRDSQRKQPNCIFMHLQFFSNVSDFLKPN